MRVVVSVAVAVLSYAFVEQPIRSGALRAAPAFGALAAATVVVVAALLVSTRVSVPAVPSAGATGRSTTAPSWPRATPALVPGPDIRQFLPPGDWSVLTNTCEPYRALPPVKPLGRTRQRKVLMVGDSVGCFIGAAFDERQVAAGIVTLNRSKPGCPLVRPKRERFADGTPEPTYSACTDGSAAAIAAFRPDIAVLMVGGPMVNEYDIGTGTFVGPCDAAFAPWYEAGARRSIAALSATGATVVVVSIVHPPKSIDVGVIIPVPSSDGPDVDCLNRMLHAVVATQPHARWFDLDAYICPHRTCRTAIDGVALRSDGRHFQGPAANVVARWMLPRVLALAKPVAGP
jgi:hypothetical protein